MEQLDLNVISFDPAQNDVAAFQRLVSGAKVEIFSGEPSAHSVRVLRTPRHTVASIVSGGAVAEWKPSQAVGSSRLLFCFVSQGTLTLTSAADIPILVENDSLVAVYPGEQSVYFSSDGPFSALTFSFHSEKPATFAGREERDPIAQFDFATARAAYSGLSALVSGVNSWSRSTAVQMLLDGVAESLKALVFDGESTLVDAAMSIISLQHGDSKLNAARIASQLQVSTSALYKAFGAEGRSVARELRRARARKAVRIRTESPSLAADLIASASGFGSVSSMKRALKEFPMDNT